MNLQDFILHEMETILQAWEEFARGVDTPMPAMDSKGLRNHAEYILRNVSADMRTSQTDQQQLEKAQGRGPQSDSETAAQTHAMTRLVAGFSMDQLVSEYRALRSSVLSLWLSEGNSHNTQVQQMVRFNESIDQALAESIATYGVAVEKTRETVLGILGHDLRAPLAAISIAGGLLQKADYLQDRERRLSNQIADSVHRASGLVDDLLDLARCNLGSGIPVCLEPVDLTEVCSSCVQELRLAFPAAQINYNETGSIAGQFDPSRIAQAFTNLISNAATHGDIQQPISVSLLMQQKQAIFSVQNFGKTIPPGALEDIFSAGARYSQHAGGDEAASAGLGLGLFIAAQIVSGHEGTIDVKSSNDQGTIFSVQLPVR